MTHQGIRIHTNIRAGGIVVNPRLTIDEDAEAGVDCFQVYSRCRTNKIKSGMSPAVAAHYCKTLLLRCQQTTV